MKKLKYNFEYVDMGEEIIAVPVGTDADKLLGILKINKEAYEIMKRISEGFSAECIANSIAQKYSLNLEIAVRYVDSLLNQLTELELIDQ